MSRNVKMPKFIIKKDGRKCEIKVIDRGDGFKLKTNGEGCKKVLGKDYFKEMEMDFEDEK